MSFAARQITTATYGGAALPTTLTVFDEDFSTSIATFTLNTSGSYLGVGNFSSPSGTWKLFGNSSDYEARYVLSSGSINNGGTLNTWLPLSSSLTWSNIANPGTGVYFITQDAIGTLAIRIKTNQLIIASSTLRIRAVSTNI